MPDQFDFKNWPKPAQINDAIRIETATWKRLNFSQPTVLWARECIAFEFFACPVTRPGANPSEGDQRLIRSTGRSAMYLTPGDWWIAHTRATFIDFTAVSVVNEEHARQIMDGLRGYGGARHSVVSVAAADILVLGSNPARRYALFVNDSTTDEIYLALNGVAAVNSGIRLNRSGGSYEMYGDSLMTCEVRAISASAGPHKLLVTFGV